MRIFCFFLLLGACSTVPTYPRKIREYKVSSAEEAKDIFRKKLNFLRLTYEQIKYPGAVFPKFSPECLRDIAIDTSHESPAARISISRVFFGPSYGTGLCRMNKGAREGLFVLVYCKKEEKVFEVSCFVQDCGRHKWADEC